MGRGKTQNQSGKAWFGFADAHLVYDNPEKVTLLSHRNAEDRKLEVAMFELADRVLALIYVERDMNIRVISFRVASRQERRAYEKARAEK